MPGWQTVKCGAGVMVYLQILVVLSVVIQHGVPYAIVTPRGPLDLGRTAKKASQLSLNTRALCSMTTLSSARGRTP